MKCESRVPKASRKTASYGLYFQSSSMDTDKPPPPRS